MSDKCNQNVKELTADSENGFPFRVKNNEELSYLSLIKRV